MAEETKHAAIFKMLDELNKEAYRKIDKQFLQDNIRLRRIHFEEKNLRESVSENGPIVEVKDRCGDDLIVLAKHNQDQKILLTVRFRFPDEYPLKPPYWTVSQCHGGRHLVALQYMDWLEHDPFQGAFNPSCTLLSMCECLLTMSTKSYVGLKDYKRRC